MILPIAGPLELALSFMYQDVLVSDYEYVTVDGQDRPTLLEQRTVQAAIDPSRSRAIERAFGGSVSDGDIGIYTKETLFPGDAYDTGEDQRQSFVLYDGLSYRVAEVASWKAIAGFNVYLGKRHLPPEVV